jgi:Xaa-Pro aminopeptidase
VEAPAELVDARGLLHEMRLKKSPFEQKKMAEVGSLSAAGHRAAMAAARPGIGEWELQNVVEGVFRKNGSRRVAYDSIVGGGPNATILHYRESQRILGEGELVLIDAGAEKDYLAADITRTFPVSGTFSPLQKRLYEIVLRAQLAAIDATRPGATLDMSHDTVFQILKQGILEEGLLGEIDAADETAVGERVRRFYMHRTSHYLGMDVHDVGAYFRNGEPRPLEAGMVITIEPGLYFAPDDETVDVAYRGIGIRIEDDILVTESGSRNLTADAPKTVLEIEAACHA